MHNDNVNNTKCVNAAPYLIYLETHNVIIQKLQDMTEPMPQIEEEQKDAIETPLKPPTNPPLDENTEKQSGANKVTKKELEDDDLDESLPEDSPAGNVQGRNIGLFNLPPHKSLLTMSFNDRETEHVRRTEVKRRINHELTQSKTEQECPFHPQLHNKTANRSFDVFLETQEAHKYRIAQTVAQGQETKKAMEASELKDRPAINEKSKNMIEGKLEGDLLERLMMKKKTSPTSARKQPDTVPMTFHPQISEKSQNIKRTQNVVDSLFDDAIKRYQKTTSIVSTAPQQRSPEKPQKDAKKEAAFVAANFTKRFDREFQEVDPENKGALTYSGFGKLLYNFGCIKTFDKAAEEPRVKELWDLLTNTSSDPNLALKESIFNALCAILLIPVSQSEEAGKLHRRFYDLYTTYTVTGKGAHSAKKIHGSTLSQDFTFHPQLGQKSQALAVEKASKDLMSSILGNDIFIGNNKSIHERFYQQSKRLDKWIEEERTRREEELKTVYTFQPALVQKGGAVQQKSILEGKRQSKCLELYELSKLPKKMSVKEKPAKLETEEEKPKELKKEEPKKMMTPKKAKWQGKSIQDSIERVVKARMEKERVQYMKQYGLINTKPFVTPKASKQPFKLWSEKKHSIKKIPKEPMMKVEPMVELNLKFGDNIENIKYSRSDDLSLISHDLAKRNNLTKDMEEKLLRLLEEKVDEQINGKPLDEVMGAPVEPVKV